MTKFCQSHLNLGNNIVTCLRNQIKLAKAQKQCRVMFDSTSTEAKARYWVISGSLLGNKKVMTVQRTKTATTQRLRKQIIEYNHRLTIERSYRPIMIL